MKIFKKMKKGFTLVELVVVIAVIAILAAVSVGAYFGVTESANNSRLEQESKQVYTAIQTVALAPNDHSSLSKDGLVITDDTKFELALEESLGKTVTLLENGNKAANEPTIFFSTTALSRLGGAEITYKTFEYHIPEISGKKAVADVVTGEVKVESSDVETGTDVPTTTVPDATTDTPTIAPTVEPTETPTTDPTEEPSTSEPVEKVEKSTIISTIANAGVLSNNNEVITFASDFATIENHKYESSTAIRTSDTDHFRYYANSKVIISSSYEISKVTFTFSGDNVLKNGNNKTLTFSNGTYSEPTLSNINANTVEITNYAQFRTTSITVYYFE